TSATVDIPTVNDDGSPGRTEFLVGPASQLSAAEVSSPYPEVVDEDLVDRMREKATLLRQHGEASPVAEASGLTDPRQGWPDESFYFTWKDDASIGDGRTSIWVHPRSTIIYKFYGSRRPALNKAWLDALLSTANSGTGLYVVPEPPAPRIAEAVEEEVS
ncbi:MAG: ATP-dependent ligase, partial [Microbacterium sp.]|nr:ATP-dependent ligase [Microbacterium sp.]